MGVITYKQEISSAVAPSRLFKAFIPDSHNVLPKIVPKWIKSVELIKGDGGVRSIWKTNFGESSDIKYTKHRIDAVKAGNYYCKYTMIKSDIMFPNVDFVMKEVKFVTTGHGCLCKMNIEYHVKVRSDVPQADINKDKDRAERLFRAVEEYLLANPNVCT